LDSRGVKALHQPPRITVVNDNEQFLALMHDLLSQEGYDVKVVDGDTATIEGIAATDPDLLVIDLRLGSTAPSGWDVLLMARAHEPLREIPVVLCSADVVELRARADEMAAIADVHVLEKPFRIEEAEELVRRLLEREPPPSVMRSPQPEPT
jgi:two-component system NtrC family response regulator